MYRPIADYALIGDLHTAALVSSHGSLDWCCLPRFDSPAVFCRLLDDTRGGYFEINPQEKFSVSRNYLGRSAALETTFETAMGKVRLVDFMPIAEGGSDKETVVIYRLVEGMSGVVDLVLEWRPTFDFAKRGSLVACFEGGAIARAPGETAFLFADVSLHSGSTDAVEGHFRVKEGETVNILMAYRRNDSWDAKSVRPLLFEAAEALSDTLRFWQQWTDRCTYRGRYEELVKRSAVTLKLLTYAPTGALIAAPTTSLPETIGGERNWDYRYSWLRDSALTLHSLMSLGYHDESKAFLGWIEKILSCEGCRDGFQILYRVDGDPNLPESELGHLSGYRESRPVRIGNGAVHQRQWDVFGEVLDSAHVCFDLMWRPIAPSLWSALSYLADQAASHWKTPDNGIWEVRGGPRHFLHSKLYCWVALDRALKLAERAGLSADTVLWRNRRDEIRQAILTDGYNDEIGAFTQSFGDKALDASALMIPLVGFLPADDPRVRSTVDRIKERLTSRGLVYRYLSDDGLTGNEAAFALCTFWLVDNLALSGRIDEAEELFENLTNHANDLGLLSEEFDPITGDLLGNFPQGFTHLALIRSALRLG